MLFDFDGSRVTVAIAFLSGLGTFFASCFFPLLPIYFAYLTGESAGESTGESTGKSEINQNLLIKRTLVFSTGFFLAFTLLGIMLSRFAVLLATYKMFLSLTGATITIILGLLFLGAIRWPFLSTEKRWQPPTWTKRFPWLSAFLLGVGMVWGWSPCIGPVLAVVLFWAADQNTVAQALLLLLAFSAGITSPFIAFGITAHRLSVVFKSRIGQMSQYLRLIGGGTMVGMGIWLLIQTLQ